jgi:uncharacterized spore protein YtfJ
MSDQPASHLVETGVNQFFGTFERAQTAASIGNVYGSPIAHGDDLVVPIASVSQLFGMGMGVGADVQPDGHQDEGVGGGGTGRVIARPVALAEITFDGVDVHPVIDENRALAVSLAFAAWAVFWTARALVKLFK